MKDRLIVLTTPLPDDILFEATHLCNQMVEGAELVAVYHRTTERGNEVYAAMPDGVASPITSDSMMCLEHEINQLPDCEVCGEIVFDPETGALRQLFTSHEFKLFGNELLRLINPPKDSSSLVINERR